jgi:DNA-binding NarL/FixJ family response regulator
VVTAELSGLLYDIVGAALESAADIRLIGHAANHGELLELAQKLSPDVVITRLDESGPPDCGWDLYISNPRLRILGVVGEGRQAFVYELRPYQTPLGELSPDALVAAVRSVPNARSTGVHGGGGIAT